jgi:DNA-binding NarL/FixJ family response regulator
MGERVTVYVFSDDPVLQAGANQLLRSVPDVIVVAADRPDSAVVAIVLVDEVDEAAQRIVRAIQRDGCPRVLVVAAELDEADVVAAAEAGAAGVLRRRDATRDRLRECVQRLARGDGSVPDDLVGRLLVQLCQLKRNILEPQGIDLCGLNDREVQVLRLIAEGKDTSEIASTLNYSERTVKGVIQAVTSRLNLKNRSHAVAFAVRNGLI